MAVQHTSFVLKVLNGFNAGAVVRLKTGSLLIGSSMNSDIILHDENIADQHIQLLITPAGITLQPLARPVFVAGAEVTAESVELQPYQTVRLGNVELQVADSRVAAPAAAAGSKPSAAANPQRPAASGKTSTPPPSGKQAKAAGKAASQRKGWSGKTWLALGLGLLLLANLIYWAPQVNRWLEKLGVRDSAEQQAATLLQQLGEQDFKLVTEADGSLSLSGYTGTALERNELMGKIRDAGIKANLHLWSRQDMVDSANMITRALGEPGIKVKAGTADGELLAQGFVSTNAAWERIRASLLNDVAGLRAIAESEFQSMDGYLAAFVQFIQKKGLSSRIEATTDGKSVIVKGELTQPEIEQLKGLRQEFIDAGGEGPAIDLRVTDIRDRIVLAIRSVSVGKVPFLVAKDGKKYMEGSALGEKYFVKAIKPDHVVLTNNGIDIPFYYGIDKGRKDDAANRAEPQK